MGYQVIKQPTGQLAIYSSYTDTIVMWDATRADVEEFFDKIALDDMRRGVAIILDHVIGDRPTEAYHQFTIDWADALRRDNNHGGRVALDLLNEISANTERELNAPGLLPPGMRVEIPRL